MTPTPACFCGLADDFTAFGQPYPSDMKTLRVALVRGHSTPERREALDAAIAILDPQLPFALKQIDILTATPAGTIRVKFVEGDHGDGQPFDGPAGILAHATGPPSPGWLHMDESETWLTEPMPLSPDVAGFRMAKVFAHELGHNLGLGHSGVPGALMFPRYVDHALALSPDDIAGLEALYDEEQDTARVRPPALFWGERPQLDGVPYRYGFAIEASGRRDMHLTPADVEGELWTVAMPSDAGAVQFRFAQPSRSVWTEPMPVASGALTRVDLSLATLGPDIPEPQPEPAPPGPTGPASGDFVLEIPAFTMRGRMV